MHPLPSLVMGHQYGPEVREVWVDQRLKAIGHWVVRVKYVEHVTASRQLVVSI